MTRKANSKTKLPGKRQIPVSDVTDRLQRLCEQEGGVAVWAKKHGFARSYVYHVLNNGRRAPSSRLCSVLGITKVKVMSTTYWE